MAKKRRSKSTANSPGVAPSSHMMGRSSHTISTRKITNGYLINEHGYHGEKHFDRETYSPKKPKMPSISAMEKKIGNKLV